MDEVKLLPCVTKASLEFADGRVARALHDHDPPTYSDTFPPRIIPFDELSRGE